jgi:E3 ubiquitin-protein ligase TRIP12
MRRAMLEVTYKDEEGTGIGPTLEFYNLLGKEIKTDKLLWRENTVDHMLYPRSI